MKSHKAVKLVTEELHVTGFVKRELSALRSACTSKKCISSMLCTIYIKHGCFRGVHKQDLATSNVIRSLGGEHVTLTFWLSVSVEELQFPGDYSCLSSKYHL